MSVTDLVNNKLKIGGTSDTDIQRIYQESYNLFQQYDMLILGFGDAYKFGYTYGAYDPSKEIPAGLWRMLREIWLLAGLSEIHRIRQEHFVHP